MHTCMSAQPIAKYWLHTKYILVHTKYVYKTSEKRNQLEKDSWKR